MVHHSTCILVAMPCCSWTNTWFWRIGLSVGQFKLTIVTTMPLLAQCLTITNLFPISIILLFQEQHKNKIEQVWSCFEIGSLYPGTLCAAWLSWTHYLDQAGLKLKMTPCLCLSSAKIKGVHHLTWSENRAFTTGFLSLSMLSITQLVPFYCCESITVYLAIHLLKYIEFVQFLATLQKNGY